MKVPEAPLEPSDHGLAPAAEGWFVLNARDARWVIEGTGGKLTFFEGGTGFDRLGINVGLLEPGQPMAMYHWEDEQEDFLVVSGEALLVVEGEERPLKAWDLVHCPRRTSHTIVGAGCAPCVIVSVGSRTEGSDFAYTVDETAAKHDASVLEETSDPPAAYARFPQRRWTPYQHGWLP